MTVLFNDLVGSTERQSRLGDDVTDDFRRRFFAVLRESVQEYGGHEIKTMGDGMMVIFPDSAVNALASALAMHERVEGLDPDDPAHLKVGISAGEARTEDGDWYGTPVNEAARLCAAAGPGQTLTTELVRGLVGSRGAYELRSVGTKTLKGLPAPVKTVELVRTEVVPFVAQKHRRPRRAVWAVALGGVVLLGVLVAAIALSGGTSKAARGVPPAKGYTPTAASHGCDKNLTQSVPGVQCGTLTVPEDRSNPARAKVKLEFIRAPAKDGATADPVLDFGAEDLALSPVRAHSDLITLYQRGGFGSVPLLECPAMTTAAFDGLTRPAEDPAIVAQETSALTACKTGFDHQGIDLSQYNLEAAGDDMLDLIRALHLKQVNLQTSYVSTVSALRAIRAAPGVVRTLTLSEAAPPSESSYTNPTQNLADSLQRYAALCTKDAPCARAYPDLPGQYRRLQQQFAGAPVIATGTHNNEPAQALVDGQSVALALNSSLFQSGNYPLVAAGIASGDPSVIASQVLNFNFPAFVTHEAWVADLSFTCSYELHTANQDARTLSDQTLPEYAGIDQLAQLQRRCGVWNVAEVSESAYADPSTDVPTLLIYGDLTPGASPDWGSEFTHRGMSHATIIRFRTVGTNVLQDAPKCLSDLRTRFLANPEAKLDVAACEKQSPAIKFVANSG